MSAKTRNHPEGIEDVYIAVTGITGAGKSEFIRLCTGKEVVVGDGLTSQTSEITAWTFEYSPTLRVHLIDTPGFDDTKRKDVEVLRDIAGWLGEAYKDDTLLSGIVYLHPISENRLRGSARQNLFMFKKLCGPDFLPAVILTTTMWDLVSPEVGTARERELRSTPDFWGEMEKKGSRVMQHHRTKQSAMDIIDAIIDERHPQALKIQIEMVDENRNLEDTDAGMKVNEDLAEADRKHRTEVANLRRDMREQDEESKRQITMLIQQREAAIADNERQRRELQVNMAKLESDRARNLEAKIEKLAAQVEGWRMKDQQATNFAVQGAEERARLQRMLEQERAEKAVLASQTQALMAQAQRKNNGIRASTRELLDSVYNAVFYW